MSREINNSEYRQKMIRDLLAQLHAGTSAEKVKAQFRAAFDGVSAQEIAQAENELIAGGLNPAEIKTLCDIHASVFEGSVEEIHRQEDPAQIPGHPAYTLTAENRALADWMETAVSPRLEAYRKDATSGSLRALKDAFAPLQQLHVHYLRKENVLFPYLEKHGITAPPKVMWGVDDDIRGLIKEAGLLLSASGSDSQSIITAVEEALRKISEMIFKEKNILLPMLLETLEDDEWAKIAADSVELGFCLIPPPPAFMPRQAPQAAQPVQAAAPTSAIALPTGQLQPGELSAMLNALPVDITFVGRDDTVKYCSQGRERIFPRTASVIGRKVVNCHPPASVHIVEKILADFKAGKKDHEDFWLHLHGKYILIRYYAVRSPEGEYLGTLEVTQDIALLQAITGEKRLVSNP